jgi:hypothetical protein
MVHFVGKTLTNAAELQNFQLLWLQTFEESSLIALSARRSLALDNSDSKPIYLGRTSDESVDGSISQQVT